MVSLSLVVGITAAAVVVVVGIVIVAVAVTSVGALGRGRGGVGLLQRGGILVDAAQMGERESWSWWERRRWQLQIVASSGVSQALPWMAMLVWAITAAAAVVQVLKPLRLLVWLLVLVLQYPWL